MIIWLNGPLGVGKSTVAANIGEKLNIDVISGDKYYYQFERENPYIGGYAVGTQNSEFAEYFKNEIEEKVKKNDIVVDMSVFKQNCKKILIDYFKENYDFIHIILLAKKETILNRVETDYNREDKSIPKTFIDECIEFIEKNFNSQENIKIDTDLKNVNEIVNKIIKIIEK